MPWIHGQHNIFIFWAKNKELLPKRRGSNSRLLPGFSVQELDKRLQVGSSKPVDKSQPTKEGRAEIWKELDTKRDHRATQRMPTMPTPQPLLMLGKHWDGIGVHYWSDKNNTYHGRFQANNMKSLSVELQKKLCSSSSVYSTFYHTDTRDVKKKKTLKT